ncbi:MAG TPA: CoA ester lyase [Chthoniobacteraceae bacterium]|nr:CoA ester lyase [Chthoniobacteraceae bacterium]
MKASFEKLAWLFVPGDQGKRVGKALASDADAVIFDLEDGVAPEAKEAARETLREVAGAAGGSRAKLWLLRVNGVDSPFFAGDLALAVELGCDGVMLPKCEHRADLERARAHLPETMALVPLIESAAGVVRLAEIAGGDAHLPRAAFGSVDFALDLGVEWTPEGTERRFALERLALESRALGWLPPLGAVYPDVRDEAAFRREAETEKRLGFFGKMVIHPVQINWLREVYRASPEQLAWSRKVVEAYEAAGSGAVLLEGKLVDRPVYLRARRVGQDGN